MELNQLLPGSPLEFSVVQTGNVEERDLTENEVKSVYLSSIFDISKRGELVIHMPTREGKFVTLPMNINYEFIINTNAGLFSLTGMIVNKGKIENFPVYVVKPTTGISKVQRRDYYRFNCIIPVNVYAISREVGVLPTNELLERALSGEVGSVSSSIYGTIVDISGGGARFTAKLDVDTDTYMVLEFKLETLNGAVPMRIVARRVKSQYKDDLGIYEHRVEFFFKEQDDREIIIKYIFDQERKLRKKNQG